MTSTLRRSPTWPTALGLKHLEVIAYQHLPVFHTEHCVFCRFLSKGTSYKDCGRPCEQTKVALPRQRRTCPPGSGRCWLSQHRLWSRSTGRQPPSGELARRRDPPVPTRIRPRRGRSGRTDRPAFP
jgi:hypothetical protein